MPQPRMAHSLLAHKRHIPVSRSRWSIMLTAVALAAAVAATSHASTAIDTDSVEIRWAQFHSDPVRFMNQLPHKKTSGPRRALVMFSADDIQSGKFVEKKALVRSGGSLTANGIRDFSFRDINGVSLSDVLDGRALARERAIDFFDPEDFKLRRPVLKLEDMESAGLRSASLQETPWSDTYWPIYMGSIGARYASQRFKSADTWKGYYDFVLQKSEKLSAIADQSNPLELESLSPSEKYDLLIGELKDGQTVYDSGYLTPHMWTEGQQYWDQYGEVEPWMGLCHGWAAASFMAARPKTAIEVAAAKPGLRIKFYPSDLKGLSTYLWSKTQVPTNFIGGRCNDKDTATDPETGRILNEKCFDTNPGNWHQIIVNQIGVAKRSFVIDATFDYEVWNQPVYSYSYKYFNPQTGRPARSLRSATVHIDKFTKDKFKKFRASKTTYVVGIEMEVTYVVETNASHNEKDAPVFDATTSVTYMYDLELDENLEIIGGEWYSNSHPDFLWAPIKNAKAKSSGDARLRGTWDGKSELPKFWRDLAVLTAVHSGLPLASIIDGLTNSANEN